MVSGFRGALLATVSVFALAASSPEARAQDGASRDSSERPAHVGSTLEHWALWVEGESSQATGGPLAFGKGMGVDGLKLGGEGALGFSFTPVGAPWSWGAEFRYGAVDSRRAFRTDGTFGSYTAVPAAGSAETHDDHWLADFDVGRDVDIGSMRARIDGGLRIASIEATTRAKANYVAPGAGPVSCGSYSGAGSIPGWPPPSCSSGSSSPGTPGTFTLRQESRFVGAGPRIGFTARVPIDRRWAIEGGLGAAALVGDRSLKVDSSGAAANFGITAVNRTEATTILNLDGHIGLSFRLGRDANVTVGYRVDGYYDALTTEGAGGQVANRDRYYSGPMLRLTVRR